MNKYLGYMDPRTFEWSISESLLESYATYSSKDYDIRLYDLLTLTII